MANSITDEEAREMMFGNLDIEDTEKEVIKDEEEVEKDSTKDEFEDIDLENDEEIKELTKQSPKLNSAFAKLRREKEQFSKDKEQYDSKFKKYSDFVASKYKNEYGIENLDQFFDYMGKQNQDEQEEAYNTLKTDLIENHDVDPSVVDSLIQNNPQFKKFEEMAKRMEIKEEQEKLNTQYKTSFEELNKKYPQFESVESINKVLGNKAEEFWTYFKDHNLSMLKAYELADIDNLQAINSKKAEQNTLNKINSKSHMKPTKFNAEVDYTDVDPDELSWYKGLMGNNWTEEKMIEHSKANRR